MAKKSLSSLFVDGASRALIGRVLKEHILPYRQRFYVALLFMILAALSNAAIPFMLQPVFDTVFQSPTLFALVMVCAGIFLAFFVKGIASFGEAVVMTEIGQKIITDIQKRLFAHFMRCDLSFFHSTSSGELISRFTNDINQMRAAVANALVGLGKDLFALIFLVSLMFYRDWVLASVTFILFPSIVLPIARIGRRVRKAADFSQEEVGHLTTHLSQIFQGMRMVKAYGLEEHEQARISGTLERILALICKTIRIRSAAHPIVETLGGVSITAVIAYGGWQVMHHTRTTGEFISFIGALILAYEPLKRLSNLNATIQEGLASAMRVFSLLDITPHIQNVPDALTLPHARGEIIFDAVSFAYQQDIRALDKVSLHIQPGQKVAFVGQSGSGKSTLINLVPRFYEATEGVITLDGTPLHALTLESLRRNIALVSQEITLFDDTIANNISYGRLGASDADIIRAATGAAAHEFIMALPEGYQTMVGEHGVRLSGGQRQRIAIARAMLKNAPILLLDEATSALDTTSEQQVQAALSHLMAGRTTLVVAHRLSTIADADWIYVMDKGHIAEQGTHTDLLAQNKNYARLWNRQHLADVSEMGATS